MHSLYKKFFYFLVLFPLMVTSSHSKPPIGKLEYISKTKLGEELAYVLTQKKAAFKKIPRTSHLGFM